MRNLFFALIYLSSGLAYSSAKYTTAKIMDFRQTTLELAQTYGAANVLVVYDIDNTLLAMDVSLGSDQWFTWQEGLLKSFTQDGVKHPQLTAHSFDQLLENQGLLYSIGSMHTPEPTTAAVVKDLQKYGFKTLVMTSRGPEFRDSTMRELKRNGMDFTDSSFALGLPGTFLPTSGPTAKPSSFQNGIFMTAGQHKGEMLLAIIGIYQLPYKAVVFLDDTVKHVDRVLASGHAAGMDVHSFHYVAEEPNVKKFNASEKTLETQQFAMLKGTLNYIWGK